MNPRLLTFMTLTMVCLAQPIFARTSIAQPDSNGDYFSNAAPVRGQVPNPLLPGSLWQVVSSRLNCRSASGRSFRIIRQFSQGEVLQADVGRGGADEVLWNAIDENGKPWMRVRSNSGERYNCYVRANSRYILPVVHALTP